MDATNPEINTTATQSQSISLRTSPKKSNKSLVVISVIVLVLLVATGTFYFRKNMENKSSSSHQTNTNVSTHTPTITSNQSSTSFGNKNTKIIYEKDLGKNPDNTINSEIWIMNTDGSQATKLNISPLDLHLLNNISNGWVYYTNSPKNSHNWKASTIYAYNYITNQSKQITEVSQPNTAVNVSNYVISPDGKKILYNISYTQLVNGSPICDQQPCSDVDLYPHRKSGSYVYNIDTDEKMYLGKIFMINLWDSAGNVYTTQASDYHEFKLANGFYKVNTDTGKATLLDSNVPSNDFSYYEYPVADGKTIIIDNLKNKDGGSSQKGDVKVIKNGKEVLVDSSGNICNSSNCLIISPDSKYALYTKADSKNITTTVMLLDLTTLTVKPILQAQAGQAFDFPTWVSNTQFVTEVSEGNYPRENHSLLLVDIISRASKALTTFSDNARMY